MGVKFVLDALLLSKLRQASIEDLEQSNNSGENRRRSIRLVDYDYCLPGAYFVTICIRDRKSILGGVKNDKVHLSTIGEITHRCWNEIPSHFPYVELDEFIVVPNHLHGILILADHCRGVQLNAPNRATAIYYKSMSPKKGTLSVIIRTFKAAVTTQCRKRKYHFHGWQRNYYEHIVRNEDELGRIREYIASNPLQWEFDRENPTQATDESYHKQWGKFEDLLYPKK
jgi:putative transposase